MPFRECFMDSRVAGAMVERGDVEPIVGSAVPFHQRASDPEYQGLWNRQALPKSKALQGACGGRGRDGDPNSAGAALAPEPTGVDPIDDGRDCCPDPPQGRRYRTGACA